jgi:hypothetical protein
VRIQAEHAERAAADLAPGLPLVDRLRAVEHAFLDVVAPYHGFGNAFVSIAVSPESPSNPLSEASAPARAQSQAIYRDVVAGAVPRVPDKVQDVLPELLWLCHLGITLFWVTDRSPGQERTRRLVDATVPLVTPIVRVARLPWGGAVVDQVRAAMAVAMERTS